MFDDIFYYYASALAAIALAVALRAWKNSKQPLPSWPVVGMLPTILLNVHRIHDKCTEIMSASPGGTFTFRGPWFSNMDMLGTVDLENVHHIMTGNFKNYPKGPAFNEIFDVLGDGIFNADSDSWKEQRSLARVLIGNRGFHRFLARTGRAKIDSGLVPVLDSASDEGRIVDLQDLFQRFTFDTTCVLVTGYDAGCLTLGLPDVPFSRALDEAEESIFMRHVIPGRVWKLLKWVGFGSEKRLTEAWKVLDEFIYRYISMKREDVSRRGSIAEDDDVDLLTCYMNSAYEKRDDDKFLRDTILNLMIAGRDTTSSALTWFVWLVSTHPEVEEKIRDELKKSSGEENSKWKVFGTEDTKNLVYLHAALCESMRLYPPVPFQHKEPVEADLLPSGHRVETNVKVLFSLYGMGRMESIWGEDCLEFKPERWITKGGTIKHEPSYKFLAFNAGPRTCLGKEVAFIQMKAVAATVVHNYRVRVAEGHRVVPNCSIILYMKDGLKVKVENRWSSTSSDD